jgi:hypothetical protein
MPAVMVMFAVWTMQQSNKAVISKNSRARGREFYQTLALLHRCIVYFEVFLHMSRKSSSNFRTLTKQKNRLSGRFFLHI